MKLTPENKKRLESAIEFGDSKDINRAALLLLEIWEPLQEMVEARGKCTQGNLKSFMDSPHGAYEVGLNYECPMCAGEGIVEGEQYINFDDAPLNVLFSGIGDEFVKWQEFWQTTANNLAAIRKAVG